MEKVVGTYRNGHIELDAPVDWPEGARIEATPLEEKWGLDESEWPTTPEEIQAWLEWFDSREPLDFSPEELAAMEAQRQADRELQKELMKKNWKEIEELF